MFCRMCGKEIAEGSHFCKYCGTPVGEKEAQLNPVSVMQAAEVPKSGKKGMGNEIAIVLSVMVALSMVVGAYYYKKNSGDGEKITAVDEKGETETRENSTQDVVNGMSRSTDTLADEIDELNAGGNHEITIDVTEDNYTPADHDYNAVWDNSLFYTLEDIDKTSSSDGRINDYNITQKEMISGKSGNRIEYEIYSSPDDNMVNKIVSIEYVDDELDITEYYYTDDGKISFIYNYDDTNYFPSYATPNRDGERFYFSNDVLTKWRVVKKGTQTNYVIGSKSAKEGTNAGSVTKYKSLSSDKKKKYDKKEKTMINQAYNTYNTVLNAEGVVLVQGYVYDDGDDAVEDTLVSLNLSGDNAYLYYTYTDSEGLYSIYVPSTNHEYEMHFSCDGYGDVTMYNIEPGEQALGDYQTAVYMVKPDTNYEVTLSMKDALNYNSSHTDMVVLGHSTYYIRQGINSKDGEVVATGNADTAGVAKLSLPGGMYTVEIEESGYNIAFFSLVVGDEHRTGQYYLSPELDSGEIRIVLTWNDTPGDLDSHLFTPYCSTEEHISYYHQTDGTNSLDVDVTTGYGPETITIKDLETVGIYKYYVADYTDCLQNDFTSKNMSYSNATVRIYTEEGLYTSFSVPTNREGVIWEVFEIRNGKVVPAQRYYKAVEDKDWWKNK